jgi:hypothetical protein
MNGCGASAFALAMGLGLSTSATCTAAGDAICSIAGKPQEFDHKSVTLKGTPVNVKQTTSRRGNDYTTFKLQDSAGCAVSIFTWGHYPLCRLIEAGRHTRGLSVPIRHTIRSQRRVFPV